MELTLKKLGAFAPEYRPLKRLFISAFPPEERPPFWLLRRKARKGVGELLAAKDGEKFVGFAYLVRYQDLAYLFLFAVADAERGKGYGSAILGELKKRCAGERLFLAREAMDEDAPNYDQRVRRHRFYLRNGFVDLPCIIREYDVDFEAMSVDGCPVSPEDYDALISQWASKRTKKFFKLFYKEQA